MVNSRTALSEEVVTGTGLFSFADQTIDIVASHQTRKAPKTMNQRRFAANTMYREHRSPLISALLGRMPLLVVRWFSIRSEEHTSELQSPCNLVCRLLLEK